MEEEIELNAGKENEPVCLNEGSVLKAQGELDDWLKNQEQSAVFEDEPEQSGDGAPARGQSPDYGEDIESIRGEAAEYPDIDISEEIERHPMIPYLLSAGYSLRSVYEFIYPGLADERRVKETESAAIANIRARNAKPESMGRLGGGAGPDIGQMSDERVLEIDSEVKKGRRVVL